MPGPTEVVKAINKALINRHGSHGNGFVTLVYGQLTPTSTGLDIELVRAGHTPPLHLDAHRSVRPVEAHGLLIGVVADPHLTPRHLHLRPHESLVLYTDGITEARRDDELFGDHRLCDAVSGTQGRPAAQHVVETITQAVSAFTGGHYVDDDQAILVLTATEPRPTPATPPM
ncbi:PP2C family protein-serine/threonine phosphatase [Streptomyces cyaneofuscatus]|uniref:PP2C family protein-serine/threonine phosphatase n=1 Tax=Streptomyces cyaneofuscatus TaxID=66883 RepID=UPI00379B6BE9